MGRIGCFNFALCIVLALITHVNGCAEWSLLTHPVIFGQTARLSCMVHNVTSNAYDVTWIGGPEGKTLSLNETSLPKYKVSIMRNGNVDFESILEIANFSEDDVNHYYSCLVGFEENRKKLTLTKEHFVLFPVNTDITVFGSLRKGQLNVHIEIRKVYPIPACTVTLNKTNITEKVKLHTDMNGIFYRIKETVDHNFGTPVCRGNLKVICRIGNEVLKIKDQRLDTCPEISRNMNEHVDRKSLMVTLGPICTSILLVLIVVVAFVGIAKYSKIERVVCCNVNLRGEYSQRDIPGTVRLLMTDGRNAEEQQNDIQNRRQ